MRSARRCNPERGGFSLAEVAVALLLRALLVDLCGRAVRTKDARGSLVFTGGYGSASGAVFGALIFGMVRQGIVMAGIDADWFQVFLGAMLLGAVLFNDFARRRVAGGET